MKLIFRGLIPIVLFAGGLFLLHLSIPGWSLIFGLPITVIGATMLVFAYDEVVNKRVDKIPPTEVL